MSETSNNSPAPDPGSADAPATAPQPGNTTSPAAAPAAGKAKKPKKPKKPGRWRRRFFVAVAALLLVVIIFRILLSLLLPWTLRRVAKEYGLDCTYERADIYLLSGDAGLWHVRVSQLDDGKPVAEAEYCRADISTLQLFRGQLVVQRLEADGVELTIQREADGTIPLLKRLLTGGSKPPPPKANAKPLAIDFTPPVAIDALRLSHVRTHIIDRAVQPVLDTQVEMNLRFSDLASTVRPARLTLELLPNNLLDSVVFSAEGGSTSTKLDAKFAFSARGLHPLPLGGYLAPLGVRATADGLTIKASGSIHTQLVPGKTDSCSGTIKLEDMALTADGQPALTLRALTVDLGSIAPGSAVVKQVLIEDGTFTASRTPSGGLHVAGLEWSPQADAAPAAPKPAAAAPVAAHAAPSAPAAGPAFVWSVGELKLARFAASFKDERVTPATELKFRVDDVTVKDIVGDPAKPDSAVTLTGHFGAPGIAESMDIDGACQPFALKKTVKLNVHANGVRPDALRPYLAVMGIESDLTAGAFGCRMSADVTMSDDKALVANAELADVLWKDKAELLALERVKITGLGLAEGSVRVREINVTGPRLNVKREASGDLLAAGFRLMHSPTPHPPTAAAPFPPSPPHPSMPAAAPAPVPEDPLAKLPKLDIDKFTWNGVQMHVDDESAVASTKVFIENAGLELTDIHTDFGPNARGVSHGHVKVWLKAPGLAGEVKLEGDVTQLPAGLAADLKMTGENLSADLAAPYLKAMGIEPTLRDGSLAATLHVDLARKEVIAKNGIAKIDHYLANVKASAIRFADTGQEMFGIDHADITGIDYKPGSLLDYGSASTLEVGAVTLTNPRGKIVREEDGAIRAMGIRLLHKEAEPEKNNAFAAAGASPAKTQEADPVLAGAAAPVAPHAGAAVAPAASQPAMATAPATELLLKQLTITGGAFAWTDRAVTPAVETVAMVKGEVQGLAWGASPGPAKIAFTIKADGFADEVTLAGTASATPNSGTAKLVIAASGLRQGKLASYLPPGITVEMKDGRFDGTLEASAALDAKGGAGATVKLSELSLRDGPASPPLFHLDSANVVVSKLDIPGGVVAIDEISAFGAETSARQSADGVMHAIGVALGKPATQPAAPVEAADVPHIPKTEPVAALPTKAPTLSKTAAPPTTAPAASGPLVLEKKKYPLITVAKLDVNVKRLAFADESRPGTPPIVVKNLRLATTRPIAALGEDPSAHQSIKTTVTLEVEKVVDSITLTTHLAPFSSPATFSFELNAVGIHGDGLLAQLPGFKSKIDASQLTDGQLQLHGETQMKIDRLDPLDFSIKRGVVCDFLIKGLEFRGEKKGPLLAGIDEIRSEGVELRPDKGTVRVRTLEVNKITGQATLENDGVHALGIVVKIEQPAPATQPAVTAKLPDTAPAVAAAPKTPPAAATATPANTGEVRLDKVVISGIDFRVEDRTVTPPLIVPLNQLDIDVRELSSRAMVEDRKMRFSVLVGAGKVPLPKRLQQGAGGMVKDAGALLGGKKVDTEVVIEQRDLFSQIQADGVLSLYPQPNGWVKTSISAFDLAAVKSEAKREKVDLNNGVFDTSIEARLPGDGSMITQAHFILTDLELKEPANGPIMRFLPKVPPLDSLDALVGALTDVDGSIDVPLYLTVKQGHIGTGDLISAALGAFTSIITKAALAAPLKAAGAATDLVGAFIPGLGGEKAPKKEEPVFLTFAPGDAALAPGGEAQLAALLKRMKEPNIEVTVRHELGGGDVARAGVRANPSPEECLELVSRLGRRKQELQRLRIDLAARARGDLASRPPAEAAITLERLHAVERELSATEDGLDRVYDLLRPGADRQAGRRTRQAALEIAQARLQSIRLAMLASGIPSLDTRIHLTRPQFNPAGAAGGKVEIVITVKKKT